MSDDSARHPPAVTGEPASTPAILRIITPGATDEEIAALVAVVSAMAAVVGAVPKKPAPVWAAPARMHRSAHATGRGAWRASGLPL